MWEFIFEVGLEEVRSDDKVVAAAFQSLKAGHDIGRGRYLQDESGALTQASYSDSSPLLRTIGLRMLVGATRRRFRRHVRGTRYEEYEG